MATKTSGKKTKKTEQPVITPRQVRVFWHKSCTDLKKTTLTTLKPEETLVKTNGTVTVENETLEVYSLKRGKRIYYLTDVTEQDILRAQQVLNEKTSTETLEH